MLSTFQKWLVTLSVITCLAVGIQSVPFISKESENGDLYSMLFSGGEFPLTSDQIRNLEDMCSILRKHNKLCENVDENRELIVKIQDQQISWMTDRIDFILAVTHGWTLPNNICVDTLTATSMYYYGHIGDVVISNNRCNSDIDKHVFTCSTAPIGISLDCPKMQRVFDVGRGGEASIEIGVKVLTRGYDPDATPCWYADLNGEWAKECQESAPWSGESSILPGEFKVGNKRDKRGRAPMRYADTLVLSKDGALGLTHEAIINDEENMYILPISTIQKCFQEAVGLKKLKALNNCMPVKYAINAPKYGVFE